MSISNYLEQKLLEHIFGGNSVVGTNDNATKTCYISLHTADPGETGANEVAGNGYIRKQVATGWNAAHATAGTITNKGAITGWAASGGDWGILTHVGLWDAATAGNFWWGGSLDTAATITDGDTFSIADGDLTVKLS